MTETIVKKAATEMMSAELLAQLRGVDILSSLTDDRLTCLAGVEEIHVEPGEYLARQGDVARSFWLLLDGALRIYQTLPDGRDMTIATAESGTAVGELPLLSNIPYVANVVAAKPSHL